MSWQKEDGVYRASHELLILESHGWILLTFSISMHCTFKSKLWLLLNSWYGNDGPFKSGYPQESIRIFYLGLEKESLRTKPPVDSIFWRMLDAKTFQILFLRPLLPYCIYPNLIYTSICTFGLQEALFPPVYEHQSVMSFDANLCWYVRGGFIFTLTLLYCLALET